MRYMNLPESLPLELPPTRTRKVVHFLVGFILAPLLPLALGGIHIAFGKTPSEWFGLLVCAAYVVVVWRLWRNHRYIAWGVAVFAAAYFLVVVAGLVLSFLLRNGQH